MRWQKIFQIFTIWSRILYIWLCRRCLCFKQLRLCCWL